MQIWICWGRWGTCIASAILSVCFYMLPLYVAPLVDSRYLQIVHVLCIVMALRLCCLLRDVKKLINLFIVGHFNSMLSVGRFTAAAYSNINCTTVLNYTQIIVHVSNTRSFVVYLLFLCRMPLSCVLGTVRNGSESVLTVRISVLIVWGTHDDSKVNHCLYLLILILY